MSLRKDDRIFCWAVTGTFHGTIIEAATEGEARRMFHAHWNGESILYCIKRYNSIYEY